MAARPLVGITLPRVESIHDSHNLIVRKIKNTFLLFFLKVSFEEIGKEKRKFKNDELEENNETNKTNLALKRKLMKKKKNVIVLKIFAENTLAK